MPTVLKPKKIEPQRQVTSEEARILELLEQGEEAFRKRWRRAINRYITSLDSSSILRGQYQIRPVIIEELRAGLSELAAVMYKHGAASMRHSFAIRQQSGDGAEEYIERILEDLPAKAREIVEDVMIEKGGTLRDAMKAVQVAFPSWSNPQLERIGRTVASLFMSKGRFDAMADAGISYYRISAILDSRICPICIGLHGLVIDLTADVRCWPPEHWSCRCIATAVLTPPASGAIDTEAKLRAAAEANLLRSGLKIGGKVITDWPGVPDGWGIPPRLFGKTKAAPAPRTIDSYFVGKVDPIAKPGVDAIGELFEMPTNTHQGISEVKAVTLRTSYGIYEPSTRTIKLSRSLSEDDAASTFLHEFAHYIDHIFFGGATADGRRGLGTFRDWWKAVNSSVRFKELDAMLLDAQAKRDVPAIRYYKYLLSPDELWARSVQQLGAKYNTGMRRALARRAALKYWDDDDFSPIAKEIMKILRQMGWRLKKGGTPDNKFASRETPVTPALPYTRDGLTERLEAPESIYRGMTVEEAIGVGLRRGLTQEEAITLACKWIDQHPTE